MPGGIYARTSEHKEKIRQTLLGHSVLPETREKLRQANLGRRVSLGAREKLRQAAIKQWASSEGRAKLCRVRCSLEGQEKARQVALDQFARLGPPFAGHKHSAVTCEKIRQARLRQTFPKKMTVIECLLHDEFAMRGLEFEMHKTMFGRFQPDFVFEQAKLIVQADGDYWHARPKVRERDAVFNQLARQDGWMVWRLGEREIKAPAAGYASIIQGIASGSTDAKGM